MENESRQPEVRRKKREKRSWVRIILRIIGGFFLTIFTVALIGACTAVMVLGIFKQYVDTTLAPTLQVRAEDYTMDLSSIIYYRDSSASGNGEWVEFQTVHGLENRIWVDFEQMPEALWQAAVSIEDERFFLHDGVDWKRTGGAVLNMFIGMKNTFGGSTITQQLLKNMTQDDDGTVNRKVREIFRALEFEKNYTKEQILELYLNTIYLGKGCYGVQTAAQYYFGKDVSELSVAECASLIAITNNPSMYGPMYDITIKRDDGTTTTPRQLNKKRQETIIDKMSDEETGLLYLTAAEAKKAKKEVLQFTDGSTSADDLVAEAKGGLKINSWFVDQVIWDVSADLAKQMGISEAEARIRINNSGYRIYTTLDLEIQEIAESVYEDRSNLDVTSRSGQQLQSGITIMDPYTGDIVAIVGKVGEKSENLGFSCATAKRQVGSSIKPLTVYAPALDAGAVTPGTVFDDYPVQLLNDNPWPKNSPNKYRGFTTVSDGVRNSINTIAVQTLQAVGTVESFAFATEKLNLGLVAEDMDISPLGMGGLTHGLNTVEMAAAYATFVNSGVYNTPRTYLRVEDAEGNIILQNENESHVAMKDTTAYLMNQMLKSVVTAGTGTSARFDNMTIAGKTGTTSQNYDRYFVGYTPYYVAAVWTGYETNEKISYTGNPAITMWKLVMEKIHEGLENRDFEEVTTGLERVTICRDSGLRCSDACHADLRGDRALTVTVAAGTAPTEQCTMHVLRDYCTEGQCLATENCPVEVVKQVACLDYIREDYGPKIVAEDAAYLIANMEKAIGLAPTIAEDGTEVYPEVIGCPVHANYIPALPPELDPSDPNYIPPLPGTEGEGAWENTDPMMPPTEPTEPEQGTTEPEVPAEPPVDPSGGFGDAEGSWWSDLWSD